MLGRTITSESRVSMTSGVWAYYSTICYIGTVTIMLNSIRSYRVDPKLTYRAMFLDLTDRHQMADLLNQEIVWPPGISMQLDGCLVAPQGVVIDGYEEVEPGVFMPTIVECRDRIHAVHGEPFRLEYFCMSPNCEGFQSVVKAATCEGCDFRRGRNVL